MAAPQEKTPRKSPFRAGERIPPQNAEAEMSVLGSLLLDRDAIIKIADFLRPADFYTHAHAQIFEAMLDLYEHREPIDILSLSNKLKERQRLEEVGGESAIASLAASVPTAGHVEHYARIVQKKATLRRLISAAADITDLGFSEDAEVDAVLDSAEQRLFGVSQQHLRQTFIPVKQVLAEAFHRIDHLHKGEGRLRGIPTGFAPLDNILSGLQKSDLIILAARPSVGKTSIALDIARNIAVREQVPTGIFSIEMSKEQLADRLICAEADVDLWKMRTGRLSSEGFPDDDFSRINRAMATLAEAPIYIDDSATSNVMEIRTLARRLQAEHGIGFLVIDYLQLMEGDNREGRVQEVSQISRALKGLARELDIPILAISQLSRAVESRSPPVPKLSDLRESGCLTGDSLITRADTGEPIPMKVLAERERQDPIPIFTLDEHWKITVRNMTKVFPSGRKNVYELVTRSGRSIKASANHPFRTLEGWRRLDLLQPGSRIALPRAVTPLRPASPLTQNELILLAHLLGDGCTVPQQPIHYTSCDQVNLRTVSAAARQLFGIRPRLVRQENWWHVYLPSPYPLARGRHNPIVQWLQNLGVGLRHASEKFVPQAVFQCPRSAIALFLRHLWATDGNISWKLIPGRKPAASIYYATSSARLARDVQTLLLRIGIWSTIRRVPQHDYLPQHHVHVQGCEAQTAFLRRVGAMGARTLSGRAIARAVRAIHPNPNTDTVPREAWRTVVKPAKDTAGIGWREVQSALGTAYCGSTLFKCGIGRSRMRRVAAIFPRSRHLQDLAAADVYWDEIVEIRPLGIQEVFDATVPGTHNFVANDIFVHNSIEQDSDVVLFLYPRGKHERTTDNPHIVDAIIAKHRNGPTGVVSLFFKEEAASFTAVDVQHAQESAREGTERVPARP